MKFVDLYNKYFNTVAPADYSVWELLNQVVQEEPSDSLDPIRLGFYASIGIQKGQPFAPAGDLVLPFSSGAMWLREPVFWYGIVAPVALLVIVTLYLFWLDRKSRELYRPSK